MASLPLEALVRAYQLFISPMLPPSCRFYPSCSAYALTALRRFGPIRGTWLAVRRLARCHPWNPGGVDHVPARGEDGRPSPCTEEVESGNASETPSLVARDHVAPPACRYGDARTGGTARDDRTRQLTTGRTP